MDRIKIAAAGLALAITAVIVPATAQAGEKPLIVEAVLDRPVIHVSYADLNLAHKAGVDQLNRRVRVAANRLCLQPGLQPIKEEMLDRACREDALDDASRQIDVAVANFGSTNLAAATRSIAVALR